RLGSSESRCLGDPRQAHGHHGYLRKRRPAADSLVPNPHPHPPLRHSTSAAKRIDSCNPQLRLSWSYGGKPWNRGRGGHAMQRSVEPIRAFTRAIARLLTRTPLLALALGLCTGITAQAQQKQVPVVIGTQPVASKQYPSPAYEAGKLALA